MKRLVMLLVGAALITIGCAHGRTSYYPKCAEECAEVTVVRKIAYMGGASTLGITLDGFPIAHVETGEYLKFQLPRGIHSIGLESIGTSFDSGVSIPFESGKKYFFLIDTSAALMKFFIQRVEENEINELLKTKRVDTNSMVPVGYQELDPNLIAKPR